MNWRKSSHSGGNGGQCVELKNTLDGVRDSKNPGQALHVDVTRLIEHVQNDRL